MQRVAWLGFEQGAARLKLNFASLGLRRKRTSPREKRTKTISDKSVTNIYEQYKKRELLYNIFFSSQQKIYCLS